MGRSSMPPRQPPLAVPGATPIQRPIAFEGGMPGREYKGLPPDVGMFPPGRVAPNPNGGFGNRAPRSAMTDLLRNRKLY